MLTLTGTHPVDAREPLSNKLTLISGVFKLLTYRNKPTLINTSNTAIVKPNKDLNINMNWISELAIYLKSKNINIDVKCYKSNLYDDYKKLKDLTSNSAENIDKIKQAILDEYAEIG